MGSGRADAAWPFVRMKTMRNRFIIGALLATAIASPALAQREDRAERFGDRGRQRAERVQPVQPQPQAQFEAPRVERVPQPSQQAQVQAQRAERPVIAPNFERRNEARIVAQNRWQQRGGDFNGQRAAPPVMQAQAQNGQVRGQWRGQGQGQGFRDRDRDGVPNFRDRDRDGDGIRNRREDRDRDGIPNLRDRDRDGDGVRNNRDFDRNNNGVIDRRFDRNRNGVVDRNFDRNRDGVRDRFGNDRGWNNGRGWNNNGWNRDWRQDRRYDWQRYRFANRNLFRQPRYFAPYGHGFGYQRFGIGIFLDNVFFDSRYRINDPWQYRLPAAGYPYEWVRYYNDVILIDTRSGYVVDVIYDFFF